MKKLIAIIMVSIMLIGYMSCGTANKPSSTWPESDTTMVLSSSRMYFTYNGYYCQYQVDSMIVADTLAPLSRWNDNIILGNNEPMMQYAFIKKTRDGQLVYTLTKMHKADTVYKCTKKISAR